MPSNEYIRDLENNRIFHSYGYDVGYKDGYAKGYEQGQADGIKKAINNVDSWIKTIKEDDNEQQGTGRSRRPLPRVKAES